MFKVSGLFKWQCTQTLLQYISTLRDYYNSFNNNYNLKCTSKNNTPFKKMTRAINSNSDTRTTHITKPFTSLLDYKGV